MSWTDAEAKKYVMSQLGHPRRKVELDHTNISEALQRAVKAYGAGKPIIKKGFILALAGVQAYNLGLLEKPYGKGLLNLYPEPITSPGDMFSEFEWYRMRDPTLYDLTDIVLTDMYYKDAQMLTGTDFDWEWDQESTILLIKPSPSRSFKCAYDYNYGPKKVSEVPLTDQGWVVDYMLALSKEMLGRVRNKFQGVPGNELPVQTDGAELISEGQAEQEALKESLWNKRGDWTPPIRG